MHRLEQLSGKDLCSSSQFTVKSQHLELSQIVSESQNSDRCWGAADFLVLYDIQASGNDSTHSGHLTLIKLR